eukprot:gene13467-biopygen6119
MGRGQEESRMTAGLAELPATRLGNPGFGFGVAGARLGNTSIFGEHRARLSGKPEGLLGKPGKLVRLSPQAGSASSASPAACQGFLHAGQACPASSLGLLGKPARWARQPLLASRPPARQAASFMAGV